MAEDIATDGQAPQDRQPGERQQAPQGQKDGPPKERQPKDGPPRERQPKDGPPRERQPKDGPPRERQPKDGPPKERQPKDGPLKDEPKRGDQFAEAIGDPLATVLGGSTRSAEGEAYGSWIHMVRASGASAFVSGSTIGVLNVSTAPQSHWAQ